MNARLLGVVKSLRTVVRAVQRSYYKRLALLQVGSYTEPVRVNGPTRFTPRTTLGKNTNFNGLTISGRGWVHIGDNFHSGPECMLITSYHNYDHGTSIPYDRTFVDKDITIEENVWLGTRVIVLGGVRLGEGCIIQAGSVVVTDIERCAIAGGSPARVFKYRDVEHYETLKAQGKVL